MHGVEPPRLTGGMRRNRVPKDAQPALRCRWLGEAGRPCRARGWRALCPSRLLGPGAPPAGAGGSGHRVRGAAAGRQPWGLRGRPAGSSGASARSPTRDDSPRDLGAGTNRSTASTTARAVSAPEAASAGSPASPRPRRRGQRLSPRGRPPAPDPRAPRRRGTARRSRARSAPRRGRPHAPRGRPRPRT